MKMTGLSHLFKWENLHNWWLTKYFFAPLYIRVSKFLAQVHMRPKAHPVCLKAQRFVVILSAHK